MCGVRALVICFSVSYPADSPRSLSMISPVKTIKSTEERLLIWSIRRLRRFDGRLTCRSERCRMVVESS